MMRAMTLALAHAAAPPFNTDFYATVAAVIPVYFLALILQTPVFEGLLQDTEEATERLRERYRRQPDSFIAHHVLAASFWPMAALLIIAAGADGEIAAISALKAGHASALVADMATWSVVFLTLAVVARPAAAFFAVQFRLLTVMVLGTFGRLGKDGDEEGVAPGQTDGTTASPAAAPAPEPGVTATEGAPTDRSI